MEALYGADRFYMDGRMTESNINTVRSMEYSGFSIESATAELRYANAGTISFPSYVLQQRWKIEHTKNGFSYEWRTIPRSEDLIDG